MAVYNRAAVYIDGINRTSNTVMPIKWANFLDERLDEGYVTLSKIKRKEPFKPLTPVEIVYKNTVYFGELSNSAYKKEITKQYVVAIDTVLESPNRSGRYNHDIYFIEITKIAERCVVDTITFTNDLGRSYTKNAAFAPPVIEVDGDPNDGHLTQFNKEVFKTNNQVNSNIVLPSILDIAPELNEAQFSVRNADISITEPNNSISIRTEYSFYIKKDYDTNLLLKDLGVYHIRYEGIYDWTTQSGTFARRYSISYYISVVENRLPLKKWTITDVIKRILDIAEPLRKGEKPRFVLNAAQAEQFDKVTAPQLTITKKTLRESLQQVGAVIHGEPRLTVKKDENGYYYEVSYDMFAGTSRSGIYSVPYVKKNASQVVNSFASCLDTNAENLVNQLDKFGGVIIEPYQRGAKTVRCEEQYVRITDENMIISTQFPVYDVSKLEYRHTDGVFYDITPWLFERSIYDTQLSSYEAQYPYSKAYGIYFSQGSKNIGGLNFKPDRALFDAFNNYAIVNIIRRATGDEKFGDEFGENYPTLAFRVTYTPIYNARIGQTKSNYKETGRAASLIYNQSSNIIEAKYYGENLKGLISRLGTVEISLTYHITRLGQIPKAGQMFDDDYYISAVSVEFLPTVIKCTIGLSKDFNRLSQYIGIDSQNRYSEVSQTQAVERNTLWKEYVAIGDAETADEDCLISRYMMRSISSVFTNTVESRLSNVVAWGQSANGTNIATAVSLPVISTAYGNSIAFSWSYKDNYSAGEKSVFKENDKGVSGYWQNDVPYCDYYGKIYYYQFDLRVPTVSHSDPFNLPQYGRDIPTSGSGYVTTIGKTPYLLRKDNREILQCNFQIDFVTNRSSLIIGSGLAEYCPAVRGKTENYSVKLYVLDKPLDKYVDSIIGEGITDLSSYPSVNITVENLLESGYNSFKVTAGNFPADGKSWAIITDIESESVEVEDDSGEPSTQTEYSGGKVLLAQNADIVSGQAFTPIYFTKKREVFDKTVWKDRL